MAPACFSGRRQFDVACGVLSRCIKADAANAGKTMAAAVAPAAAPTTTMLLMPGADVTPDVREEATAAPQLAQLTITYGDRVLVFDEFPSDRVAELVLVAERRSDLPAGAGRTTTTDIPAVARKASLQRFMEKRRDRLVGRAPYAVAARPAPAASSNKGEGRNLRGEQDNAGSSWLGLGVPGGRAC